MDQLESYFERLELLAFFSGFPLVYLLVSLLTGRQNEGSSWLKGKMKLLPYAYALVGILYVGYVLKELYPDYSWEHIRSSTHHSYLKIWAASSILFWIPFFSKRTHFSLMHSLVFMYLLLKDIFSYIFVSNVDRYSLKNDMNVYTDSLLLNTGAFLLILITVFIIHYFKRSTSRV
jgi:hypothetical protein